MHQTSTDNGNFPLPAYLSDGLRNRGFARSGSAVQPQEPCLAVLGS